MAFFNVNLRLIYLKFDEQKFTTDLTKALDKINRGAARAWLKAVVTKVPVWTGEARGSLRPLGQFLNINIPINPSSSKWAQRAIAAGHTADAGATQQHFELKIEGKARVIFEFQTDVVHYFINEFYNLNPPIHLIQPAPWHSLEAGRKAYDAYIEANIYKILPQLKSYLIREKVTTHE